jgi:NTE family protein
VLASACLPQLFKAVEIDGEAYWDGGYSANPALTPLIQGCASADLVLVQINPLRVPDTPQSAADIDDRVNELTFNASLLTQMRTIEYVNALIAEGALRGRSYRTVRMHRVDGGEAIRTFPSSSRTSADAGMIDALFRTGQQAASHWLERHYEALGQHGTVDIRRDYLDDTRVPAASPAPAHGTAAPVGFRPWLAQLLHRRRHSK